jgi:LysR family transcriptional regulator, transcriptional activator of the cysJI operon
MDFRRLEAFRKVYELKSFSRAGETLYLSQPTVSAHVAALEAELNARLFDRWGKMIMPTQAGEILYRRAGEAFESLARAVSEIRFLHETVAGSLSLGASTIPADYLLPRILAKFLVAWPEVRPELVVSDSAEVVRSVAKGEREIGVVGFGEEREDVSFAPLLDDDLALIAAPQAASPGGGGAKHNPLDMPWVLRGIGSGTRKALEAGLAAMQRGVRDLNVVLTVESTHAVLQCVKAGLGVSLVSRLAAAGPLARNEVVELAAPGLAAKRRFYCVTHVRRTLSPAAARFIELLTAECANMRV